MRIAQVAPLFESVPPRLYGGTERIVFTLTEELVRHGHDVTLFASADSVTRARLVPCCDRAIRLDARCQDDVALHGLEIERVDQMLDEFDVVHYHTSLVHYPSARRALKRGYANVTTLHGRLDLPELAAVFKEFPEIPIVSISNAQRKPMVGTSWTATVYHGLMPDMFQFQPSEGEYFAFLGRFSPEKRADRAIEIARTLAVPLKLAAKIDTHDYEYYKSQIEPLLDSSSLEFVGEIGEHEKSAFLGHARALLFPIDWPEPFGLVMIEALACGTPVVAFRNGSVSEVIHDAVTGFVVDDMVGGIAAARMVDQLDRARCRSEFERRFSAARMTQDYLNVYRRIINQLANSSERAGVRAA